MQELVRQRCYRHRRREAVARCKGCKRYFCRECVTEHEGRLLCSACLAGQIHSARGAGGKTALFFQFLQFAAGFVLIWLVFFTMGHLLLSIPTEFHEGAVWTQGRMGGR